MTQMNVDVFDLARRGEPCSGAISTRAMPRLQSGLVGAETTVNYTWQGFTDARQRPAAHLQLQAHLQLPCTHCEQPVPFELDAQRDYYFVRDERALQAIAVDDADEEPLVGDTHFDLAGLIEDELILALPIAPRHDACQRQIETTEQVQTTGQRPFAVLEGLKSRRG